MARSIQFPFRTPHPFPRFAPADEAVASSLEQLAQVGPTERVMRPGVGTRSMERVFEDEGDMRNELIRAELMAVYGAFEPRAVIHGITFPVDERTGEANEALVEYTVLSTGERVVTDPILLTQAGVR